MKDLFETPEILPIEIQKILEKHLDGTCSYAMCRKLAKELEPYGYEFDWGLDGDPYNLRKTPSFKKLHIATRGSLLNS